MMEARKVQKVGHSTLIVSLPKEWVVEVGLKQGDIVSFRRESDGGITIYPGLTRERESYRYVVSADLCNSPNLLTRIITANYLTGHDTIQVVSGKELSKQHLEEGQGGKPQADGARNRRAEPPVRNTAELRGPDQVPNIRADAPFTDNSQLYD